MRVGIHRLTTRFLKPLFANLVVYLHNRSRLSLLIAQEHLVTGDEYHPTITARVDQFSAPVTFAFEGLFEVRAAGGKACLEQHM